MKLNATLLAVLFCCSCHTSTALQMTLASNGGQCISTTPTRLHSPIKISFNIFGASEDKVTFRVSDLHLWELGGHKTSQVPTILSETPDFRYCNAV